MLLGQRMAAKLPASFPLFYRPLWPVDAVARLYDVEQQRSAASAWNKGSQGQGNYGWVEMRLPPLPRGRRDTALLLVLVGKQGILGWLAAGNWRRTRVTWHLPDCLGWRGPKPMPPPCAHTLPTRLPALFLFWAPGVSIVNGSHACPGPSRSPRQQQARTRCRRRSHRKITSCSAQRGLVKVGPVRLRASFTGQQSVTGPGNHGCIRLGLGWWENQKYTAGPSFRSRVVRTHLPPRRRAFGRRPAALPSPLYCLSLPPVPGSANQQRQRLPVASLHRARLTTFVTMD
jgi:hypothetical protein